MRHHHHQQPRTVAILATNKLAGRPRPGAVLEYGDYDTKLLEAYPTELIEELLNGVDVLLLTSYLVPCARPS